MEKNILPSTLPVASSPTVQQANFHSQTATKTTIKTLRGKREMDFGWEKWKPCPAKGCESDARGIQSSPSDGKVLEQKSPSLFGSAAIPCQTKHLPPISLVILLLEWALSDCVNNY